MKDKYEIVIEPNAIEPNTKIDVVVFWTDHMGVKRTYLNMTMDKRDEAKGRKLAQDRIDEATSED